MPETIAPPARPLLYGRKYQTGLNITTTVAMAAFHVGGVLAFFFVDAGAIVSGIMFGDDNRPPARRL